MCKGHGSPIDPGCLVQAILLVFDGVLGSERAWGEPGRVWVGLYVDLWLVLFFLTCALWANLVLTQAIQKMWCTASSWESLCWSDRLGGSLGMV